VVRARLAALAAEVMGVELLALRVVEAALFGRSGTALAAANKVAHTECAQRIAEAALELGGPDALAADAPVEFLWRQSLWETIGGGTSEVMRGVVARQALGLG
jgi:alkylation response protein AidB-like acyl-CoA dehydrogenase